jgi:hypothetical protein
MVRKSLSWFECIHVASVRCLSIRCVQVTHGVLKAIVPHSGHYRPTPRDFDKFCGILEDMGVPMADVQRVPFKDYAKKDHARNQMIDELIASSISGKLSAAVPPPSPQVAAAVQDDDDDDDEDDDGVDDAVTIPFATLTRDAPACAERA